MTARDPGMARLRAPASGEIAAYLAQYGMLGVLVLLTILFSIASSQFLTVNNGLTIANNAAVAGLLALGQTWVLVARGIDLSVGSLVTMTTVMLGVLLVGFPIGAPLAILVVLLAGAAFGALNGILVVRARVPAIIVTLGTLYAWQSVAQFITGGATTSLAGVPEVVYVGQGYLGGIPVAAIVWISATAICHILFTRTRFGTYVRAVGGNSEASTVMGLDVGTIQIAVFALSGLLAAVAGIVVAGQNAYASSQAGVGLELRSIAAAVLGGTSLAGGSGSIAGTLVGVLIFSVIFDGLILIGVPFFYQLVVTGVVLVVAVAFNQMVRRR
jgi:ribose/xylose/arabinose/galactoside ABC-type transport system permease subunit